MEITNKHYIHTHPMYEIKFEDAIGKDSHTIVQIFNKTNKEIAYKIRTTHPKQFIVQPNQYILRPETNMKVDFHMLPSDEMPSATISNARFKIEAMPADNSRDDRGSNLWDKEKIAYRNDIQQIKLNVVFTKEVDESITERAVAFEDQISPEKMRQSAKLTKSNLYNSTISHKESVKSSEKTLNNTNINRDYKKDYVRLLSKVEEQENLLLKVSEERNQYSAELNYLKENLDKKKQPEKMIGVDNINGFQLWHMVIVAVVSLLAGAFLSS